MSKGALTVWTHKKREKFLETLRATANISKAARSIGVSRQTAYNLRQTDAGFCALWDDAIEEGLDSLEQEVRRRAFEGVEKPVFYQGQEVATVREYSDTLAIFYLKGNRPEKYRERFELEVKDARQKAEAAVAEFMKRTGRAREDAIEFLKPHIPQISELIH